MNPALKADTDDINPTRKHDMQSNRHLSNSCNATNTISIERLQCNYSPYLERALPLEVLPLAPPSALLLDEFALLALPLASCLEPARSSG